MRTLKTKMKTKLQLKLNSKCKKYLILGAALITLMSFGRPQTAEASIWNSFSSWFSNEPDEVRALREEPTEESDGVHIEYYFQLLSSDQKTCYRQILKGVIERKTQIYLTFSQDEIIDTAYHAVMNDHPELFWIHNRKTTYKTTYEQEDYCLFEPGYSYTDEEMNQIQTEMENAYAIINGTVTADSTDYGKIKAIYEYLIDSTSYVASEDDQSIAGTFWKKEAVCAGYAKAFQYLAERFGVYSIYVEGDANNSDEEHAWNIVRLDGNYYYVDVTNGDQPQFIEGDAASLAEHKTTVFDYLCPFPWEYEKTYTANTDFSLPQCTTTDYNFYVLNQGCFEFHDYQTILNYCKMRIDNGAAVIRFKFTSEDAYHQAYSEWIDQKAVEEVAQYYMSMHGINEVQYHYGVLEQLNTIYFIF